MKHFLKNIAKLSIFLLVILYGCAQTEKKSSFDLYPDEKGPRGYQRVTDEGVFANKALRVSVKQLRLMGAADTLIEDLIKKDYIVLWMEIENRAQSNLIFNPVHAALTTDTMDYKKPLDYTDLYDLARAGENAEGEKKLAAFKGKFYDLALTLPPGGKASRFLIFPPLSKGTTSAELVIKELYIGTTPVTLSFPFAAKTGA